MLNLLKKQLNFDKFDFINFNQLIINKYQYE